MSDMIATTEEKGTTAVARQDKGGNGASGKPDEGRKSTEGARPFRLRDPDNHEPA